MDHASFLGPLGLPTLSGGRIEGLEDDLNDLLPVVPRGHDAMLDGVFQGEDTSLRLSLVTDVGVLVAHADHDGDMSRSAKDRGEDGAGSVITSETGLDHSRAIVNDHRRCFFVVTHLAFRLCRSDEKKDIATENSPWMILPH